MNGNKEHVSLEELQLAVSSTHDAPVIMFMKKGIVAREKALQAVE